MAVERRVAEELAEAQIEPRLPGSGAILSPNRSRELGERAMMWDPFSGDAQAAAA